MIVALCYGFPIVVCVVSSISASRSFASRLIVTIIYAATAFAPLFPTNLRDDDGIHLPVLLLYRYRHYLIELILRLSSSMGAGEETELVYVYQSVSRPPINIIMLPLQG